MNVLLLTTGSVSAPLSGKLVKVLRERGHNVEHILSKNAELVWRSTEKEFPEELKYKGIEEECNEYSSSKAVLHIDVVNRNDVCVVCPADFNIIGKVANGIADDVVSSTLAAWMGSGKKIFFAEAMNSMMYSNPAHLENVRRLNELSNTGFIEPTVKKLACGDYGIGGLADVNAIADSVDGHSWHQPIKTKDLIGGTERVCLHPLPCGYFGNLGPSVEAEKKDFSFRDYLPKFNEPGAFGAKRKYDRHEGVDIYCRYGAEVFAVEDGEVVDSYQFTGTDETGSWWNPTWCLKVKGHSGVITYGELKMPDECPSHQKIVSKPDEKLRFEEVKYKYPKVGSHVKAGDMIGYVGKVLPDEKRRSDIRNHNNCMLHMELRKELCHLDGWKLDEDRDRKLLDPTPYLKSKALIPISVKES